MSDLALIIDSISRLDVRPGDTLVLRVNRVLSKDLCTQLRDFMRQEVPASVKVLVLPSDVRLEVQPAATSDLQTGDGKTLIVEQPSGMEQAMAEATGAMGAGDGTVECNIVKASPRVLDPMLRTKDAAA